jgi:curved DNA-binding protein CbpA
MKNYYTIFGVNKKASSKEIDQIYNKYKTDGKLTIELQHIYNILSDYHSRRNYDDTLNFLRINIPFFGYDFDEKYIETYKSFEKKRYHIDTNRYLIYEKSNVNGKIIKKYYIETDGNIQQLSEDSIKKIKEEYMNKNTSSPHLLKDSTHNKVLPK